MGRKIAISAICLIIFRLRHDQLVPNLYAQRQPVPCIAIKTKTQEPVA